LIFLRRGVEPSVFQATFFCSEFLLLGNKPPAT
jgi:hypothetical protein